MPILLRIFSLVIIVALMRAVTGNMRHAKVTSENGVINLPNIAPLFLLIAGLFTVIMLSLAMDRVVFAEASDALPIFIFTGVMDAVYVLLSLPSINWYLWPKEDEIVIRNWLGKIAHYSYNQITSCVRNPDERLDLFADNKKIASLGQNLSQDVLISQLEKHGIIVMNAAGRGQYSPETVGTEAEPIVVNHGKTLTVLCLAGAVFFVFLAMMSETHGGSSIVTLELTVMGLVLVAVAVWGKRDSFVLIGDRLIKKKFQKTVLAIPVSSIQQVIIRESGSDNAFADILGEDKSGRQVSFLKINMDMENADILVDVLKKKTEETYDREKERK